MRPRTKAAVALALLGILAWCLLLFGIGLDDLTNNQTEPGVIFSLAVLIILIPALGYGLYRMLGPSVRRGLKRF